jgi:hypothetical protein
MRPKPIRRRAGSGGRSSPGGRPLGLFGCGTKVCRRSAPLWLSTIWATRFAGIKRETTLPREPVWGSGVRPSSASEAIAKIWAPTATTKGTCDDSELTIRCQQQGIRGVFVPQARCLHYVDMDRLRVRDFLRYGIGKGENQARMDAACPPGSLWHAATQSVRGMRQAAIGRWDRVLICAH